MEKINVFNYKRYQDGPENDVMARVCHVNYAIQGINDANDVGFYELDVSTYPIAVVNTRRGIIDISGMGSNPTLTPGPAFNGGFTFYIDNPSMNLTLANRDNIYVQYSVYYRSSFDDTAVPYMISSGVSAGVGFTLFNASPSVAGADQWKGDLYVYYELYTKN